MPQVFAVTHGSKETGSNPSLNSLGRIEIRAIGAAFDGLDFEVVYCGTGLRFETTQCLLGLSSKTPVIYCPLLGGAESSEACIANHERTNMVLASGNRALWPERYWHLTRFVSLDLWACLGELVAGRSGRILLVTGREFIGKLICDHKLASTGSIYEINVEKKEIKLEANL